MLKVTIVKGVKKPSIGALVPMGVQAELECGTQLAILRLPILLAPSQSLDKAC
jgi:hypothetical protein